MASADTRIPTIEQELTQIAASPQVHAALDWLRANARELAEWQMEVARIPAPSFHEEQRAAWMRARFVEFGLHNVHVDGAGNVLAVRPGAPGAKQYVMVSAHLDTVFPPTVPMTVSRDGPRLFGPGISDNACGLTALLALASAMQAGKVRTELPILFVANVGEEGEGDLRGMRFLYNNPEWRDHIVGAVMVDGGGADSAITEGLGSRRFEVSARGPGGHSWSDFGTPNPILVLARAIDLFSRTSIPTTPKTTFNVGVISGGTSVNAIPESASFKVDLRSSSVPELDRLEKALRNAVNTALSELRANNPSEAARPHLTVDVRAIGNRPAAVLAPNARILQVVQAVDRQLGINTRLQRASTDANIPLSLGREAVTLGGGGSGGGAHTVHEWYDTTNREVGLKRVLFTLLTLSGVR